MAKTGTQVKPKDDAALPATLDTSFWAADAGAGLEGADRDSFAIPFLAVLQANSPQVGEVEGAAAGALINTVSNLVSKEALIVPCAFQRRWVRWGAREAGGGFKGELTTAIVNDLRTSGQVKELDNRLYFPEQDGSVNPKRCDRLSDTRNHYVLIIPSMDSEFGVPAVFALTSTGIKVSKNLLTRIQSIQSKNAAGELITAPSFSHVYRVTTVKKTNEKGTWYQPEIAMVGPVQSKALYLQARAFHKQVAEGAVQVAHETARPEEDGGGSSGDGF